MLPGCEPHIETVFVIRVRGKDRTVIPMGKILPMMSAALLANNCDPEKAEAEIMRAFVSAMGAA